MKSFGRISTAILLAALLRPLPLEGKHPHVHELGANVGTPGIGNVAVGYWGDDSFPLVMRASGMCYGWNMYGAQADLGYTFRTGEKFRHYIALSAMTMYWNFGARGMVRWTGIGPSYGFNLYGLSLQVGCSFGVGLGDTYHRFPYSTLESPQLTGQVGFSFLGPFSE